MPAPVTIVDKDFPHQPLEINSDGSINVVLTATGATATQVEGTAADGAAAVGNPVQIGGVDGSGNAQSLLTDTSGRQQVVGAAADGAAAAGNPVQIAGVDGSGNTQALLTTTAGALTIGSATTTVFANNSSVSPIEIVDSAGTARPLSAVGGGQYLSNANQTAVSTGNFANVQLDPAGNVRTAPQRPTAADITVGYLQHTSTTAAATLLTIAAGRTWVGRVTVSVAASKAAAATGNGLISAVIATAGTNVTPAAATVFAVSARIGANAASGLSGTQGNNWGSMPMTVVAPTGNSVTLTLASTLTNTTEGAVDAAAYGILQ